MTGVLPCIANVRGMFKKTKGISEYMNISGSCTNIHITCSCFNRYLIRCVNCITTTCVYEQTGIKVLSETCISTNSAFLCESSDSFNKMAPEQMISLPCNRTILIMADMP